MAKIKKGKSGKSVSKSSKAGLQFPVSRFANMMKKDGIRVGMGAPIYLAAVTEYLCAELLELSGNTAKDYKRKRINLRDTALAFNGDEEFDRLFNNLNFNVQTNAIIPHINKALLKSNSH